MPLCLLASRSCRLWSWWFDCGLQTGTWGRLLPFLTGDLQTLNGQPSSREQGSFGQQTEKASNGQAASQANGGRKREFIGGETCGTFNVLLLFFGMGARKGQGSAEGTFPVDAIQRLEKTRKMMKCKNEEDVPVDNYLPRLQWLGEQSGALETHWKELRRVQTGDLHIRSERDEVWMRQTMWSLQRPAEQEDLSGVVWPWKVRSQEGQGETPATVKEKLTKGLDAMQNKKKEKPRNNKEEENSWVPGKKNETERGLGYKGDGQRIHRVAGEHRTQSHLRTEV